MYLVAVDHFLELLYVFAPADMVRNISYPYAWKEITRDELDEVYLEYPQYRIIYKELIEDRVASNMND